MAQVDQKMVTGPSTAIAGLMIVGLEIVGAVEKDDATELDLGDREEAVDVRLI
jgi:hypothetical protein